MNGAFVWNQISTLCPLLQWDCSERNFGSRHLPVLQCIFKLTPDSVTPVIGRNIFAPPPHTNKNNLRMICFFNLL